MKLCGQHWWERHRASSGNFTKRALRHTVRERERKTHTQIEIHTQMKQTLVVGNLDIGIHHPCMVEMDERVYCKYIRPDSYKSRASFHLTWLSKQISVLLIVALLYNNLMNFWHKPIILLAGLLLLLLLLLLLILSSSPPPQPPPPPLSSSRRRRRLRLHRRPSRFSPRRSPRRGCVFLSLPESDSTSPYYSYSSSIYWKIFHLT